MHSSKVTRREWLRRAVLGGTGAWLAASRVRTRAASPNEKLNLAVIGIGGRGRANLNGLSGENIVALCDVDDSRAGDAYERFPHARKYYDFRRLLDDLGSRLDAVVVSTPDHSHFHPVLAALQLGKHCYCEKPLAHSLYEARRLTTLAAEKRLATQLGVQRHALANVHRVVELVQAGAIGEVRECHAWIGGDRGMPPLPTEFPPVPAHLKWDLWLGPAAARPYSPAYAPYQWRFWWDFGTGETGNWGCHILDVPYRALDLKYPASVHASGPSVHPQTTPKSMTVRFEFPARGQKPPVTLHWYHTKEGPAALREHGLPHFDMGILFVGGEGMLLCDFAKRKLYPEAKFVGFEPPAKSIPDSPGFYHEWINACKGGPAATCNFNYAGPLTETVLLGNVAYRAGVAFEWNAQELKPDGNVNLDRYIHPPFREGWRIT